MVGFNQNMLMQKARESGFQGKMEDFPNYLQQNASLAAQSFNNTPSFAAGGYVPPIEQVSAGQAGINKFTFNNSVYNTQPEALNAQNLFKANLQQQQVATPTPTTMRV